MSAIASLNFNDLSDEIHGLIFGLLASTERGSVLCTCKKWYQAIVGTKAFWREVEVNWDASKVQAQRKLRIFSERSSESLISITYNRIVTQEEELMNIFASIAPSASSVKSLNIRQVDGLNRLTRNFAKSFLPNLRFLVASQDNSNAWWTPGKDAEKALGVVLYRTGIFDLSEEQLGWLSNLRTLRIGEISSEAALKSVLKNCKVLKYFWSKAYSLPIQSTAPHSGAVTANSLEGLFFPHLPNFHLPSALHLIAPKLKSLRGRLAQVVRVATSSNLEEVTLRLEREGSEGWSQQRIQNFRADFEAYLSSKPSVVRISFLELENEPRNRGQSQAVIDCLRCSEAKAPLCPRLEDIRLYRVDIADWDALARMVISREQYEASREGPNFRCKFDDGKKLDNAMQERYEEARNRIKSEID